MRKWQIPRSKPRGSMSRRPRTGSSLRPAAAPPKLNGVWLRERLGAGSTSLASSRPNWRTAMSVPNVSQGDCANAARVRGWAVFSTNKGVSVPSGSKSKQAGGETGGDAVAGSGGRANGVAPRIRKVWRRRTKTPRFLMLYRPGVPHAACPMPCEVAVTLAPSSGRDGAKEAAWAKGSSSCPRRLRGYGSRRSGVSERSRRRWLRFCAQPSAPKNSVRPAGQPLISPASAPSMAGVPLLRRQDTVFRTSCRLLWPTGCASRLVPTSAPRYGTAQSSQVSIKKLSQS